MKTNFLIARLVPLLVLLTVHAAAGAADPAPSRREQAVALVEHLKEQGQIAAFHRKTGQAVFVGGHPGRPVDTDLPVAVRSALPPARTAADYLNLFAPAFGLDDPQADAQVTRQTSRDRVQHTRYRQTYKGLPVLGGELIVNLDRGGSLLSVGGRAAPGLSLDTVPGVTEDQARRTGLGAVSKWHRVPAERLAVTLTELSVFYPAIIDGAGSSPARLVWHVEVGAQGLEPVRELVLVDALTGRILLHFNQVHAARNRLTYDANSGSTLPGTLVCNESDTACNGIADAANAHLYTADTYDYYKTHFGRDGIDGAGMTMISTVRFCPQGGSCPYQNAFWNGAQMVYGQGFSSADDVVAHELTHGVTDRESGLFYYYQSGAINEALSDIFGELVDHANGHGNDSPSVLWLMGEDLSIGVIRSLSDPPAYGDPDRMQSGYYYQGSDDGGGVHTNSGVANKAAYLMAAGGTFSGKTVTALGNDKTAAIWYGAQTSLLISSSDYLDLYNALYQSCVNLVGTAGITAADCQQVRNATDAVEMNQDPPPFLPEAGVCAAGQAPASLFFDNFDAGAENWISNGGTDPSGNPLWSLVHGYARSEPYSLYGIDDDGPYDAWVATKTPIAIPAGAYLRMEHAFGFEMYSRSYFDGGVAEYSTDGGATWKTLAADSGQTYNGTISSVFGNPLAGRSAFVAESHGYVSSRFSLAALAGTSAKFRFRIGADISYGGFGWSIDNVHVYTCGAAAGNGGVLDVDGNGSADALSDGLLIIRYLLGMRGGALVTGAVGPAATRISATDIEAYLQTLVP